ncbi:hypothetical protein C0992_010198 [Termitomyces sp. T32_za158]|nr:hypothetical protein C0992_010198 [Termitomyces sp. T32_za158]
MSTRYALRNQQPGKSVRRLSLTAMQNMGPLQHFGTLALNPTSKTEKPEISSGEPSNAEHATIPTEIIVDAAELQAGGKVNPVRDDDPEDESSLSSSPSDIEEPSKLPATDNISYGNIPGAFDSKPRCHLVKDKIGETLAEARSHLTDAEREQIDRRMENLFQNNSNSIPDYDYPEETHDKDHKYVDGGETAADQARTDIASQYDISHKDVLDYLKNKRKLAHEMDRLHQKEKTSHKKHKDCARSEPILDKLTALIQKVAEGSRNKHKYKPSNSQRGHKHGKDAATKPITQIMAKSALGRAFNCLGKHPQPEQSDSDPSSADSSLLKPNFIP